MLFERIAIIGLGLLGGSIAKTCKTKQLAQEVIAFDTDQSTLELALKEKIIDHGYTQIKDMPHAFDLVIICTPLACYPGIVNSLAQRKQHNFIVTDVGSTKRYPIAVFSAIQIKELEQSFVPAHPIAGSEQSGYKASNSELITGKSVILTPSDKTSRNAIDTISRFWHACGCNLQTLKAQEHDEIYATISHLPQLLAFCYADFLAEKNFSPSNAPDSFMKFQRLAASNRHLWQGIFDNNQDLLERHKNDFLVSLQCTSTLLYNSEIEEKYKQISKDTNINSTEEAIQKESCNFTQLLPYFISAALIKSIPDRFIPYAGTGLRDFCTPLTNNHYIVGKELQNDLSSFIDYCQRYRLSSAK